MRVEKFLTMLGKALNSKTLYVQGGFGANGTVTNKVRYSNNLEYNKKRSSMIYATDKDTFFFDCINLGKGILYGWTGDTTKTPYCGARYCSNGVPDFGTEQLKNYCTDISTDFKKLTNKDVGRWLYVKGHCGYFVGFADDGLPYAIECTPKWKNGVQFTCIDTGDGKKSDRFPMRKWTWHGKSVFIDY